MGQSNSTQHSIMAESDIYGAPEDEGFESFRPLTFSQEVGPIMRARALVAQAYNFQLGNQHYYNDPMTYLVAQFLTKLGEIQPLTPLPSPISPLFPHKLSGSESSKQSPTFLSPQLTPKQNKVRMEEDALGLGKEEWKFHPNPSNRPLPGVGNGKPGLGALAALEYDWLVDILERGNLVPREVDSELAEEILLAGMACWLGFWQRWGDGPPSDEDDTIFLSQHDGGEKKVVCQEKEEETSGSERGSEKGSASGDSEDCSMTDTGSELWRDAGSPQLVIRRSSIDLGESLSKKLREIDLMLSKQDANEALGAKGFEIVKGNEDGEENAPRRAANFSRNDSFQPWLTKVLQIKSELQEEGYDIALSQTAETTETGVSTREKEEEDSAFWGLLKEDDREEVSPAIMLPSTSHPLFPDFQETRKQNGRKFVHVTVELPEVPDIHVPQRDFQGLHLEARAEVGVSGRSPEPSLRMWRAQSCRPSHSPAASTPSSWSSGLVSALSRSWTPNSQASSTQATGEQPIKAAHLTAYSHSSPLKANGERLGNGTLQQAALREAMQLLLLPGGEAGTEGGTEVSHVPHGHWVAHVARVAGLAASLAEWQPTAACLCLLLLLNKAGRGTGEAEVEEDRESEGVGAHGKLFLAKCLLDVLDGCGLAGNRDSTDRCVFLEDEEDGEVGSDMRWTKGTKEWEDERRRKLTGTLALSELAELAYADWLAMSRCEPCGSPAWRASLCHGADVVYRKQGGPGTTAVVLMWLLGTGNDLLHHLSSSFVATVAARLDAMGCTEAGFRARLLALSLPLGSPKQRHSETDSSSFTSPTSLDSETHLNLDPNFSLSEPWMTLDLEPVLELTVAQAVAARGGEAVPLRIGRLLSSASEALRGAHSSGDRQVAARQWCAALAAPLVASPKHPQGEEIARAYFQLAAHAGVEEEEEEADWKEKSGELGTTARMQSHRALCAEVLACHLAGSVEGLGLWARETGDPRGAVGWSAWRAMADVLAKQNPSSNCLNVMWWKAVIGTHKAINEEGSGTENESLSTFDWALENILVNLPTGNSCVTAVPALMDAVGSYDYYSVRPSPRFSSKGSLILAMAARLTSTIYWRWSLRKESAQFVARLLKHVHEHEKLTHGEMKWAVSIAMMQWGWTMPRPESLLARCENVEEAEEIINDAIVATWNSIASWEGDGPISCIGEKWPL